MLKMPFLFQPDEIIRLLSKFDVKWEIERKDIHLGKLVGHGAFGKVYYGEVYNNILNKDWNIEFAVKMLKGAKIIEYKS